VFCLSEPNLGAGRLIGGFTALAAGALLLIGFLTPVAGTIAAIGAVAVGLSVPALATPLFGSKLTIILSATMLIAIALLGAGAFSVDARVFGHREIIIPRSRS
jgi:uncharacterized membrane protein YphA (DoxX/SURF4 family)